MLSHKEVKFYITENFTNGETELETARNALICIAQELQRFEFDVGKTQQILHHSDEIRDKLNIHEKTIRFKNKQLRKLKGNLKIVCLVSKIIMAAKAKEINLLFNNVNIIQNEKMNLQKSLALKTDLIEQLHLDHVTVYDDMQHINNFIHLGYQEVQKMRRQQPKEIPHIIELKEILLACGQYYADYCNEHKRCTQLERQNRFLKTKLNILENNLVATNEELYNLKNQNMRLTRTLEAKQGNVLAVPKVQSDLKADHGKLVERFALSPQSVNGNCPKLEGSNSHINIVPYLSAISNLLFAQDSMLQDLKKISEELVRCNN